MRRCRKHVIADFERLEPRDCPAVVSIAGTQDLNENGGPITLTLSLSAAQATPVEVGYSASGSATAGLDYRLSVGSVRLLSAGVLTFRPGQTSISVTVTPFNDTQREGTETFTFQLTSARGHTLGDRIATVTILDDDNYTASVVGPTEIAPGDRNTYTLQLSSPATKLEMFYVTTVDGTARWMEDYFPNTNYPVAILPGQSSVTFNISARPNVSVTSPKAFTIRVQAGSFMFPSISDTTVSISGSAQPLLPMLSVDDVSLNEGNSGISTATFTVALSKPNSSSVTVAYATADGTALVSDNDYKPASGTLTFAPGETSKTVTVNVIGDAKLEPDEVFSFVLTTPMNATLQRAIGTATIRNDEIDQPGFQITMEYDSSVPNSIRTLFDAAAAKWSRVITGDLPSVQINGLFIDDLVIVADVRTLANPQIIAQAGFTDIRIGNSGIPAMRNFSQNGLPYLGTMTINSSFVTAPGIGNTIAHEMGHVLGFGTLWANGVGSYPSLVRGIGTADPRFLGPNALREYKSLFGISATGVPLYDSKQNGTLVGPFQYDGSYGSHWRDDVFNYTRKAPSASSRYFELMTAQYDVTASLPGGQPIPSYLSRATVGAMADLGYQVNYFAADAYRRPAASVAFANTATMLALAATAQAPAISSKQPVRTAVAISVSPSQLPGERSPTAPATPHVAANTTSLSPATRAISRITVSNTLPRQAVFASIGRA